MLMSYASMSVNDLLAAFHNGTLVAGTHVLDLSRNVDANIDALETVAQAGLLGGIDLLNNGRPAFAVTPTQLATDASAIALVSSPYLLEQRITAANAASATLAGPFQLFGVVDSAANIVANLSAIEALRDAGRLGTVRLTDAGVPVLHLSAAQVSADINALQHIPTPFSIALTDSGTPTITLPTADQATAIYTNVIAAITTPFALAYSGYQRAGTIASIEIGVDHYSSSDFDGQLPVDPVAPYGSANAHLLPSGIQVIDYQGSLGRYLDQLQIAAAAGKLTSVTLRDPGVQVLSITPAQATADAQALALFSPNFQLSQIISASQAASPPALDPRFLTYTVQDSLPNVLANLSAVDELARTGLMPKLQLTEPAPDLAFSAAQLGQAIYLLSLNYESFRTITLTDPGTPTVTIGGDVLSGGSVQALLNQIPSSYHISVTGRISSFTAATIVSNNNNVLADITQVRVADFSGNIVANLASLETLAGSGKLAGIDLLDGGVPLLNLSAATISADAAALAKISSPYVAGSQPATSNFSVASSQVPSQLAGWEGMAEARTLGTINLTDGGTPTLLLSAATVAQDLSALAAISSAYQINLTDAGTPALTLAPWQVTTGNLAALARIATPYSFSVSGPISTFVAQLLAGNTHLTGTISILDYVNFPAYMANLETLFQAGHLGTITLLNAGQPRIAFTSAQMHAGPDVLHALASPHSYSLTVTAAAAASTTIPAGFTSLTVSDTAANIDANLAALEPLTVSGRVAFIQLPSGTQNFSLTAAQLGADADVFLHMSTNYSISLTDPGTPTVTLHDWQIASNINTLLDAVTTPVSVVIDGPIRPNAAATLVSGGNTIINKLAPNAVAVRDAQNNFTTFFALGLPPISYMPQLLTLANAGKLASVDFRNALPYLSLTPADATTYQPVLAKAVAPFLLSQVINVAGLPTATAANLAPHFINYSVLDTSSNIMAALPQIEALGAAGLLGRLEFIDASPPLITTSAASIMANADAWGAEDNAVYPIVLTDSGTPVISLPSYQLGYDMRNDVLDGIVGPWQLKISDRVSANLMATIAVENNGVLAHLATPVTVADFTYNVAQYLDELEYLTVAGKIGGIQLIDPSSPVPVLEVSQAQAAMDADAIRKISGTFFVFDVAAGAGDMRITNQQTVNSGTQSLFDPSGLQLGKTAGALGDVSVAGTGSLLSNTGSFVVGGAGLGSLTIQNGGAVTTDTGAIIAAQTGSDGSGVTITGTGSDWKITGGLVVGGAAAGALSISAGGAVTAATLDAAVQANSSANIVVAGSKSTVGITGSLSVGEAGSGEFAILNGATVTTGSDLNIGQIAGGSGNVDVEGSSTLVIGGNLNLGAGGPGELTVGPNATVMLDNGGVIAGPGAVENLFNSIDPLFQNGGTLNIHNSGTQNFPAYVNNATFNLSAGVDYVLNTPTIEGNSSFSIGTTNSELVLNGDGVSSGTTISFSDTTGTLKVGIDQLATIQVPASGTGPFTPTDNPNLGLPLIGGFDGTVVNFASHDLIIVDTTQAAGFSQNGSLVSVIANDGPTIGTFTFANAAEAAYGAHGGIIDNVVCFAAGTAIATPDGDVPVERLSAGDRVLTLNGEARAIIWIGTGKVLATRGRRNAATPVIVRKGALADNVPHRDLHVTKGHSFHFDGVLVPIEFLVNHRSILWDDRAQEVTIYHIELATHDVLLANGAPAESYRDDGNRWLFQNSNPGWTLPPQAPCTPVLTGGPTVDAIWRRLMDRVGPRKGLPLTDDPDVHLFVDGKRLDPIERNIDRYAFRLPRRPGKVRLCSRSVVPQELGIARDARQLGVAVERIELVQAQRQQVLKANASSLTQGWQAFEPDAGIRWTDGDATVPARLFAGTTGAAMLIVHLGAATQYLDEGEAVRAA
jgi:T5SS/PEP-CTERM-associated repeat protein